MRAADAEGAGADAEGAGRYAEGAAQEPKLLRQFKVRVAYLPAITNAVCVYSRPPTLRTTRYRRGDGGEHGPAPAPGTAASPSVRRRPSAEADTAAPPPRPPRRGRRLFRLGHRRADCIVQRTVLRPALPGAIAVSAITRAPS